MDKSTGSARSCPAGRCSGGPGRLSKVPSSTAARARPSLRDGPRAPSPPPETRAAPDLLGRAGVRGPHEVAHKPSLRGDGRGELILRGRVEDVPLAVDEDEVVDVFEQLIGAVLVPGRPDLRRLVENVTQAQDE